jgi:hypothetical protein
VHDDIEPAMSFDDTGDQRRERRPVRAGQGQGFGWQAPPIELL